MIKIYYGLYLIFKAATAPDMQNPEHLEEIFIRPVLQEMAQYDSKLYSESAVALLLGTIAQESLGGYYLKQIRGPALGIYQIEPATHQSIWENYLKYRPDLKKIVQSFAPARYRIVTGHQTQREVTSVDDRALNDPSYATAIARLVYFPAREPLPAEADIEGLGQYWDTHYNKNPSKGFVSEFVENWEKYASTDDI